MVSPRGGSERSVRATRFQASQAGNVLASHADGPGGSADFLYMFSLLSSKTQEHYAVGYTPYGLSEARLLIEGTEWLYGIPFDRIDGDEHQIKCDNVKDMNKKDFLDKVKDHGFSIKIEAGMFCVIPPGMCIMNAVKSGDRVHGLRWSLLGNQFQLNKGINAFVALNFSYGTLLGNDCVAQIARLGHRYWKYLHRYLKNLDSLCVYLLIYSYVYLYI